MKTFESWLEERFIEKLEVNGVPITKDNCEDMFSSYLENLDTQEVMDLAQEWGGKMMIEVKEQTMKAFEPMVELLEEIKGAVVPLSPHDLK